jgi:hypothetical protein
MALGSTRTEHSTIGVLWGVGPAAQRGSARNADNISAICWLGASMSQPNWPPRPVAP